MSRLFRQEDVVVLAGVEGRVEVDEVDGLVGDVLAEDLEVVSVVELIFIGRHSGLRLARRDSMSLPTGFVTVVPRDVLWSRRRAAEDCA